MSSDLCAQQAMLRQLTRTDPDPRVRRRAHALLLLAEGHAVVAVARLFVTAPHRVRAWRARFLARGRQGLADEPRTGRPPKLDAAALAFLAEALEASPQAYGLPVTVWSIRDLREVLAHRLGIRVCATTVHRAVQRRKSWPTAWASASARPRSTARCSGWATAIAGRAMTCGIGRIRKRSPRPSTC